MMGGCIHGTERDHRCYRCEPETPAELRQKAADEVRWAASRERLAREKAAHAARKARTPPSDPQPGTQPGLPGEVKQSPAKDEQGQSE